jgi:hypothetical protein
MTDRAGVETALRGWQDQCRREGSLAWIRSRARHLPRRRSLRRAAALGATLVALGAPAAVHGNPVSQPPANPGADRAPGYG